MASSLRSAFTPPARNTALRSHCKPKISRSPPTTKRKTLRGKTVIAGPNAAMINARSPSAAAVPISAERQCLGVPIARTTVVASTASTAHARKSVRKRADPFMSARAQARLLHPLSRSEATAHPVVAAAPRADASPDPARTAGDALLIGLAPEQQESHVVMEEARCIGGSGVDVFVVAQRRGRAFGVGVVGATHE